MSGQSKYNKAPGDKSAPARERKIGTIEEIVHEQMELYKKTGRWLTYGELVAGKTR